MTRGTHQVGAFTAGLGTLVVLGERLPPAATTDPPNDLLALVVGAWHAAPPLPPAGWPILALFFVATLLGGTAPDLDKPHSLWAKTIAHRALGGHRHLSHSILGFVIAGLLAGALLGVIGSRARASLLLPWLGFMAGFLSHLALDSLTTEGVPWLFPLPMWFGFPPWSQLRIRTGSLVEQYLAVPVLLTIICWLGYGFGAVLIRWWA